MSIVKSLSGILFVTYRVAFILAELNVDLEVDDGRVAELERLEATKERPRLGVLLKSREDWIGGTAAVVEQLDLLVLESALGDEVASEDVKDAVAVELDADEERLAELRPGDVLALGVDDAEDDAGLGGGAVDNGGGDSGDGGGDTGIGVAGVNGSINVRRRSTVRYRTARRSACKRREREQRELVGSSNIHMLSPSSSALVEISFDSSIHSRL